MDILQHTLGIMIHPDSEWKAIRAQRKSSHMDVFASHVPLLALIPTVSAYIGVTQVGWAIGDGEVVKLTAMSAATLCAMTYLSLLVGIYIFGEFINWMERTFGVSDSPEERHYEGMALAVYVTTPLMLAGIANLYPALWVVATAMAIAGAYAVYLIYEGIPILMNIPEERGFIFASSVITAGLVLLVTVLVGSVILWTMGVGPVYI
jgi:hypothetical protein